MRYLNFLSEHSRLISYADIGVKVPEPAVFAIHKLMISGYRTKAGREDRDLEAAAGVLNWIFTQPDELKKLKAVLKSIPKRRLKNLTAISARDYPQLRDEIEKN